MILVLKGEISGLSGFKVVCLFVLMQEIFSSFSSKLDIKSMEHFSLILSGPKKGQVSYIQNYEKISEVMKILLK